ncbi:MAG: hypothetical protein SPL10_01915 [Synergistales bacterium]|nr:hypothetical protein [Synergistales bacterium]MDY6404337.1 hypothetical protein [Synergistales bacterium]MDY6413897.1 hypothetical protein [Synergistales bacterium]MDY6422268.1 hypothetical protein [Synergistales bacterium]MDY6429347.1 hypothetical protein [Synergistales bacterium]
MARKKFPDLAEDFSESVPEHFDAPQVHESTYISRAVASQIENSRRERRNLELGMSQGRKGLKLKRMTMAFSDMNYDFMRTYARQKGITATQLVNDLLSELRKAVYKY